MRNLILFVFSLIMFIGCDKVSFRKTPGGMPYQVFKGKNGKPIANGDFVKFNQTQKINDSFYFTSFGKLPAYRRVDGNGFPYDISEIWNILKTGDSIVTIQMMDTFIKRNPASIPPQFKKGDRITTYYKILEVFSNDSVARIDYEAEMQKDAPRQKKELEEQNAKTAKEMKEQMEKEEDELKKSGEIEKELKAMEAYLTSKNIKTQKTGRGTYVQIKQQGKGPTVAVGDSITVKYSGRKLVNDSTFQTNIYTFPVGLGQVIPGWDEGLLLFKKGGKGTLFIPGFLAYGKHPPEGSPFTEFDALIFDVEIVDVKN